MLIVARSPTAQGGVASFSINSALVFVIGRFAEVFETSEVTGDVILRLVEIEAKA